MWKNVLERFQSFFSFVLRLSFLDGLSRAFVHKLNRCPEFIPTLNIIKFSWEIFVKIDEEDILFSLWNACAEIVLRESKW